VNPGVAQSDNLWELNQSEVHYSRYQVFKMKRLFFLMTIFAKTLFPFVGSDLVPLSFFTARHNFLCFLK
jgi:hypothetical protein